MEDARFERNGDFVYRRILDEAVLVPIHRQLAELRCLYTLNDVGALVWEKLERPATKAELQEAILDEYEARAEEVARDLGDFLQGMVEMNAIRRV